MKQPIACVENEEDNRLMLAVKAGDLEGIGILFEKYHGALIGFFRKVNGRVELSEDLTQETFWRILRYRESYDSRRPFRAWMYQIARNIMYDHLKKETKSGRVFQENYELVAEKHASNEEETRDRVERSERATLLREALGRLPIEKRELIVLCRFEELPHAEIAPMFGCSVGALKVKLYRALQELRVIFLELGGERSYE